MTDPANDPAWLRLLAAARRSLERTGGGLDGSVSLSNPDDAERLIVIGITGVHRSGTANRLTVRVSDVDTHLRQVYGRGLADVVAETGRGPLRDRPAERAREAQDRDQAIARAMAGIHAGADWYTEWLESLHRDGTITRLTRLGRDLGPVVRALDELPAADEPMPVFAERVLGDTKALGETTMRTLLIRAIVRWRRLDPPTNAEDERAVWESVGIVPDDLASQVLALNLPASGGLIGGWLTGAALAAVPIRLTLHQLRLAPIDLHAADIFVTENPAVLRAACALGPAAPAVVCTEGVPSAAVHRLLGQARSARLWWRNDFDWAGIRMTATALARYPNARPWRMAATDYRAASASTQPLLGSPASTPWDPELELAMVATGRAVMEERILSVLLDDLRAMARR